MLIHIVALKHCSSFSLIHYQEHLCIWTNSMHPDQSLIFSFKVQCYVYLRDLKDMFMLWLCHYLSSRKISFDCFILRSSKKRLYSHYWSDNPILSYNCTSSLSHVVSYQCEVKWAEVFFIFFHFFLDLSHTFFSGNLLFSSIIL